MPPGLLDFLKKNAKFAFGGGLLGAAVVAGEAKGVLDADNKFKALLKTFKDFLLVRVAMVGLFTAMSGAIKALVRDSGSLEAALKKLSMVESLSRQMQKFVGGVQAAKQRLAEISQISQRGPFKFEEIAQANKSLEVFTRGAFSSVEATKEVGKVAIASGNSIEDTARAVGMFYATLREGGPIQGATEQLRQMGIISGTTADHLNSMAENGETVSAVFGKLREELNLTAKGAAGYRSELETITAEHEKAIQVLKEKFASPFTGSETKNIQNMTAAYQAITPVIANVAKMFAVVYNGFSTFSSAAIKAVASSKLAQGAFQALVVSITAVTVAAALFGTVAAGQLTRVILGFSASIAGLSGYAYGAARALQALALVGTWGLVAGAVLGLGAAIYKLSQHNKEVQKDFQNWSKAHQEATASLAGEIAAVKTLTEKNEALAKTIKRIIDLENERKNIKKDYGPPIPSKELENLPPTDIRRLVGLKPAKEQEALNKNRTAQIDADIATTKQLQDTLRRVNPAHEKLIDMEAERAVLIQQESAGAEERNAQIRRNVVAETVVTDRRNTYDEQIVQKQTALQGKREEIGKIEQPGRRAAAEDIYRRALPGKEAEITRAMVQQQREGLAAPQTSAVFLETRAEQMRQARDVERLDAMIKNLKPGEARQPYEIARERAKALSGGAQFTPAGLEQAEIAAGIAKKLEARVPNPEEERQAKVTRMATIQETQATAARSKGDVRTALRLEDLLRYTKTFESLRPALGKEQAEKLALEKTKSEIGEQYAQAGNVVGYLQSIGGGGGLPQQGVDLQRRMVELLSSINEYNKQMAGGQPTGQDQQQTPAFFFNP